MQLTSPPTLRPLLLGFLLFGGLGVPRCYGAALHPHWASPRLGSAQRRRWQSLGEILISGIGFYLARASGRRASTIIGTKMKQKVADVRENLSPELLYAAFHFAELTKTVEKNKIPNQIELLNHRSYVIASVFSAVSFIEANINELFEKSEDKIHGAYGISKEVKEKLFPIYNLEMFKRGAKTLEKYETALLLLKQKKMEQGAKKYQDVKYLIELRNAFIHFKPELIGLYIEPDLSDLQDLEKKLSNRFTENPYTKPVPVISIANQGKRAEYPFFPERCFSYSCARWACISSMIFADSFYKEIDMKPLYETIKKDLPKL